MTGHTYGEYTYIQAKYHTHKIIFFKKATIVIMIAICLNSLPTGSVPQECLGYPQRQLGVGYECILKRYTESPYGQFSPKTSFLEVSGYKFFTASLLLAASPLETALLSCTLHSNLSYTAGAMLSS